MVWQFGTSSDTVLYRVREFLAVYKKHGLSQSIPVEFDQQKLETLFPYWADWQGFDMKKGQYLNYTEIAIRFGFITPKLSSRLLPGEVDPLLLSATNSIARLSGRPFEITPNGYRLLKTDVVTGQQECFLRSLLAYNIPSVIEKSYKCAPFSPLKFVIDTLFEIERQGGDRQLSFEEYALFIQTSSPDDGLNNVTTRLLDFRKRRKQNQEKVRQFDQDEYRKVVLKNAPGITDIDQIKTKANTLDDYADLSFRYLKATGLFKTKGRAITLSPIKEALALLIHEGKQTVFSDVDYLVNLWNGSPLPTDNVSEAIKVIDNLSVKIKNKGGNVIAIQPGDDVSQKRHVLEQQLSHIEEEEYYRNQADQTDEITAWLDALASGKSAEIPGGEKVSIPRGEAPAYFEWIIWRAFLAINSLTNKPWNARRFQIDQDFLPVGTAPGNGPDMVFEFDNIIIVVEVTLTTSSRQEAAEGEPVRRHVAKYVEKEGNTGKPVYGLFIAVSIDTNTANTFRIGDWYLKDDTKVGLQIVPLKLADFSNLFNYGKTHLNSMPLMIRTLLMACRAETEQEAPVWKNTITAIVEQMTI